ncbi:2TM domain-containing protein [Chitinophaga sp. CC14]|uniref:2TM domain-containing protein n=1 Tax=Chitinophaga sp. CC14 TaxID=3029199 RepID=UPI003B7A645B
MSQSKQFAATTPINAAKGFKIHLIVFLLATPAIWLVWYLTDRTYPWPLWSTPAWAIGVLFHYLGVFVFKKSGNS